MDAPKGNINKIYLFICIYSQASKVIIWDVQGEKVIPGILKSIYRVRQKKEQFYCRTLRTRSDIDN